MVSVTVGLATEALLRPVAGFQLYEVPATGAVPSCALAPEQKEGATPAEASGKGFTVTVTVPVPVQPLALVVVRV